MRCSCSNNKYSATEKASYWGIKALRISEEIFWNWIFYKFSTCQASPHLNNSTSIFACPCVAHEAMYSQAACICRVQLEQNQRLEWTESQYSRTAVKDPFNMDTRCKRRTEPSLSRLKFQKAANWFPHSQSGTRNQCVQLWYFFFFKLQVTLSCIKTAENLFGKWKPTGQKDACLTNEAFQHGKWALNIPKWLEEQLN